MKQTNTYFVIIVNMFFKPYNNIDANYCLPISWFISFNFLINKCVSWSSKTLDLQKFEIVLIRIWKKSVLRNHFLKHFFDNINETCIVIKLFPLTNMVQKVVQLLKFINVCICTALLERTLCTLIARRIMYYIQSISQKYTCKSLINVNKNLYLLKILSIS